MSATIPEKFRYLLEEKVIASFASHMANGQIQVNPVWCDFDGTHVRVNSAVGRLKDKNVRANPNVTLLLMNPENGYHALEIRGEVVEITEEGAWEHIDELSLKYTGKPYPSRDPNLRRVLYKIMPLRARGIDYTDVYQKLDR